MSDGGPSVLFPCVLRPDTRSFTYSRSSHFYPFYLNFNRAGDLMQDLKTGSLLRASPRSQFYGQLIGSFASVFVSVGAYKLYTSVYEIPGPEFRVPTAGIW